MSEHKDPAVEMVVQAMGNTIVGRHQAAETLERVAQYGSAGCFPHDVTCDQLGRALHRICINAPEEDPLLALLTGWRAAQRDYHKRCDCIVPGL